MKREKSTPKSPFNSGVVWGLIAIGLLLFNLQNYRNFWSGPVELDKEKLISISSPNQLRITYVTVKGDAVSDVVGRDMIGIGIGINKPILDKLPSIPLAQDVSAEYALMFLSDRIVLIKTDPGKRNVTVTGELTEIPDELKKQTNQAREEGIPILPFMLDATEGFFIGISGYIIQPLNALMFLVAAGKIMAAIGRISS
jgi:hypothetical protein